MKISTVFAIIATLIIGAVAWYSVETANQGKKVTDLVNMTVMQKEELQERVRPQARPSDLVEIGNHWIWAHELVDCQLGAGPICTDDQPRGLSDTDLAVLNALGGEDI
jgi:hypothetical protein